MKFHKAFYKTFSPYFSPKYFKNIFPKYFIKINYSEYKHSTYVLPKFHKIPKVFFKYHFIISLGDIIVWFMIKSQVVLDGWNSWSLTTNQKIKLWPFFFLDMLCSLMGI